ncbi:hypothetical protein CEXT_588911 [Caerostris extrusa]|uniref:Uncharacterized protein n=1 Tax=Caerostris extrusa TaxID=172846 RepID=A0AAV4TRP6_CAEEX|nr:hypothetical protein CEXT_588911 [Caerostris extrusa]
MTFISTSAKKAYSLPRISLFAQLLMAAVMITGRKEDSDLQRRKLIPFLDPLNPTTDNDKALRQSLVNYTSRFAKQRAALDWIIWSVNPLCDKRLSRYCQHVSQDVGAPSITHPRQLNILATPQQDTHQNKHLFFRNLQAEFAIHSSIRRRAVLFKLFACFAVVLFSSCTNFLCGIFFFTELKK